MLDNNKSLPLGVIPKSLSLVLAFSNASYAFFIPSGSSAGNSKIFSKSSSIRALGLRKPIDSNSLEVAIVCSFVSTSIGGDAICGFDAFLCANIFVANVVYRARCLALMPDSVSEDKCF